MRKWLKIFKKTSRTELDMPIKQIKMSSFNFKLCHLLYENNQF